MKESYFNFENQSIVVTGGAKGIGASIVGRFLQYGARVVIADVDESGEEKADRYRKEGFITKFVHCDVSRADHVDTLFANVDREFGGIDVLVNNAGIFPRADLH